MEFFRIKKDIPFMRYALVFNLISALTFVAAVFFLLHKNLNYSVEFTGGTVMELRYEQPANLEQIRHALETLGYEQPEATSFGTAHDVMLRLPVVKGITPEDASTRVSEVLCKAEACTVQKVEFVGPQVGDELTQNGLNALVMVVIGVMIYLAIRFEWKFAVAAIIANLHDVVIILGFFAFFQWEFSLTVLAGILAVLGYSVNESVVIFDRIRENFRKRRNASVHEVIDNAITSTISRTIITHGCTQMMVLSMLFLGGPTLHHFAMALTIGICFGIYSSVFVAAAVAMWLGVERKDLIKPAIAEALSEG